MATTSNGGGESFFFFFSCPPPLDTPFSCFPPSPRNKFSTGGARAEFLFPRGKGHGEGLDQPDVSHASSIIYSAWPAPSKPRVPAAGAAPVVSVRIACMLLLFVQCTNVHITYHSTMPLFCRCGGIPGQSPADLLYSSWVGSGPTAPSMPCDVFDSCRARFRGIVDQSAPGIVRSSETVISREREREGGREGWGWYLYYTPGDLVDLLFIANLTLYSWLHGNPMS